MYSILDQVDKHIKTEGIPFKEIIITPSYLPAHLNQAILNKVRSFNDVNYDFATSDYVLSYDKNGTLYMMVQDIHGRHNICISNHSVELDADYYITFIHESKLISDAIMLEKMDSERQAIRKMIRDAYQNISMVDKVKLENNIINTIAKDRLTKQGYADMSSYVSEINDSVSKINDYIDSLNAYYMEDLRYEEGLRQVDDIFYVEPEQDTFGKKGIGSGITHERANEIMDAETREKTLENYPYIYRGYAYTSDKSHIEYMNYLYMNNGKYILVMEPYNGIKHTKIAIIDANREITKEEFIDMVQYYLQLSHKETLTEKTVVRTYHTTADKYMRDINYAITGEDEKNIHPYFKGKIRQLREQ